MTNFLPALGLGAISGVRSMMGLAFFTNQTSGKSDKKRKQAAAENPAMNLLNMPQTATVLKVMAAGEMVMDKMPFIPARTDAVPLLGRVAMGGLVGAAVSKDKWIQGGIVGALGALVATFVVTYLRKTLNEEVHIPNVVLGIAEDALVTNAANAIVHHYEMI